jgi:hypothetical protein
MWCLTSRHTRSFPLCSSGREFVEPAWGLFRSKRYHPSPASKTAVPPTNPRSLILLTTMRALASLASRSCAGERRPDRTESSGSAQSKGVPDEVEIPLVAVGHYVCQFVAGRGRWLLGKSRLEALPHRLRWKMVLRRLLPQTGTVRLHIAEVLLRRLLPQNAPARLRPTAILLRRLLWQVLATRLFVPSPEPDLCAPGSLHLVPELGRRL